MKNEFFEVNLCNDDEKRYKVICSYTPLLGIREKVSNKRISVKCPYPLCNINYGLTCENDFNYIDNDTAKSYLKQFEDKDLKKDYTDYLHRIEIRSFANYDELATKYKKIHHGKIKKKTR